MGPGADAPGNFDDVLSVIDFKTLQWGRGQMPPEILPTVISGIISIHASMGPGADAPGNANAAVAKAEEAKGFNGAGGRCPRK